MPSVVRNTSTPSVFEICASEVSSSVAPNSAAPRKAARRPISAIPAQKQASVANAAPSQLGTR